MAFFKFLKTAVKVLTIVVQVMNNAINAYEAAKAGTAYA